MAPMEVSGPTRHSSSFSSFGSMWFLLLTALADIHDGSLRGAAGRGSRGSDVAIQVGTVGRAPPDRSPVPGLPRRPLQAVPRLLRLAMTNSQPLMARGGGGRGAQADGAGFLESGKLLPGVAKLQQDLLGVLA